MFDAAFANIATGFSNMAGGPFHEAVLRYSGEPVFDDGGSIISPGVPFEVGCKIQVDVATEGMRLNPDFLQTDVTLLVLGPAVLDTSPTASISAGPFAGNVYALRSAERDPVGIGWICRGRKV